MLERVDHIGIVVRDLGNVRVVVESTLGLRVRREQVIVGRPGRSVFYRCGDIDLELIEVLDPTELERRLGGTTARIEHIAFAVSDLQSAIGSLTKSGVRTTDPVPLGGRLNSWTVPETSGGIMFQLVQDSHD